MEFLCESDFEIKHIKGKENKVVDALNRKVQEMHLASLSIFQSDLSQRIVNCTTGDELYGLVKYKLPLQCLENSYEGYKLEEYGLLTYKGIIYILNVADLRRVVMDEIDQAPYSSHQDIRRQLLQLESSTFWQE